MIEPITKVIHRCCRMLRNKGWAVLDLLRCVTKGGVVKMGELGFYVTIEWPVMLTPNIDTQNILHTIYSK